MHGHAQSRTEIPPGFVHATIPSRLFFPLLYLCDTTGVNVEISSDTILKLAPRQTLLNDSNVFGRKFSGRSA